MSMTSNPPSPTALLYGWSSFSADIRSLKEWAVSHQPSLQDWSSRQGMGISTAWQFVHRIREKRLVMLLILKDDNTADSF